MIEFKGQMPYYIVQYKPAQRAIRHFEDRPRRAGIGQWHDYDHVACTVINKCTFTVYRVICIMCMCMYMLLVLLILVLL